MFQKMQIWFILAHTPQQGISNNGKIPWHCPADLQFLRKITTINGLKNSILMGRKTFQSIGKPLSGRTNIVVSNSLEKQDGVTICDSIYLAISYAQEVGTDILWIFGGADIYDQFLEKNYLSEMISGFVLTTVPEYECDRFVRFSIPKAITKYQMRKVIGEHSFQDGYNLNIYSNVDIKSQWNDFFQKENLHIISGNNLDKDYLALVGRILYRGTKRATRNGKVFSSFSDRLSADLSRGFPLLTTKKVNFNAIVSELLWFIKGETNSQILEQQKVNIWKGNTSKQFLESINLPYQEGIGGPIYGFQWRHFGQNYKYIDEDGNYKITKGLENGFDQLQFIIDEIKANPHSRRLYMSAWNPNQLDQMCLPPCHISYQFYVEDGKLSCQMYQRSADVFLGLPFNIASTALLTHLVAKMTDLEPDYVHICLGDVHIYEDHLEAVKKQLERQGKDYDLPMLNIVRKPERIEDFTKEDIVLENYQCHSFIKANMLA